MTETSDQLSDTETAVLACLLNASAGDITIALKQLPRFTDPVLEWARQSLAAAVAQHAPLWPASIVAAGSRAGFTTPPGIRGTPSSWLYELMSNAPPPLMLFGLVDELEQAAIRNAIAAYGRALADNAHRGDLDDQAQALRQALVIVLRIQELDR